MIDPVFRDIGVHIIDMDPMIREHVISNEDGSFSIFLNAKMNKETQIEAYYHALHHIANDDFYKDDADAVEAAAHSKAI